MFRVLVVLFLMFSINSVFAGNIRSRIMKNKKAKTHFSFTYQSNWFSTLSKKQKKIYLKTVQQLVVNLSKADKNSAEFKQLQDLFISKAYAGISNGFVSFSSSTSVSRRATKAAYGDFWRRCPRGTSLCALYMGLNSSGKAMCANNSTPSCVGDVEALNKKIDDCEGDSSSMCSKLRDTMADGTKGVSKYCNGTMASNVKRSSKAWCKKALDQLDAVNIPNSPADASGPPEGADCKRINDKVRVLQMRKMDEATKDLVPTSNGSFWGNMVSAAAKACGKSDIGTLRKKLGSCSLPATASIKKNSVVKLDDSSFDACVAQRTSNKSKRIESIQENSDWSTAKKKKEIEKLNELHEKLIATMRREGCTFESDGTVSYSDLKEYKGPEMDRIYEKLGRKESLSSREEGLFARATGMNSKNFKTAFCKTTSHERFKTSLSQKLGYNPKVHGALESSSEDSNYQIFLSQIKAAKRKLLACQSHLIKAKKENDCDFHPVKGLFNIGQVNKRGPYVAEKNGKCLMIMSMKKENVTASGRDSSGSRNTKSEYSFIASVPGKRDELLVMNLAELGKAYKIKSFACKSKTNLKIRGCETDPEKVDNYDGLSGECKDVYDSANGGSER